MEQFGSNIILLISTHDAITRLNYTNLRSFSCLAIFTVFTGGKHVQHKVRFIFKVRHHYLLLTERLNYILTIFTGDYLHLFLGAYGADSMNVGVANQRHDCILLCHNLRVAPCCVLVVVTSCLCLLLIDHIKDASFILPQMRQRVKDNYFAMCCECCISQCLIMRRPVTIFRK